MADGLRTDDMALATVMVIAGYPYTLYKMGNRKGVWDFTCDDAKQEEFDDLIDEYREFRSKVEPKEFITRYMDLKIEMFRFLGLPPRRRSETAPAT